MSWFALTTARSARPPKFVSYPQMRWLEPIIESLCDDGSWSSTWLQCTVILSPGFHKRTALPTRNTTPDASEPMTCLSMSWRFAHLLSLPRRASAPKVLMGSKMLVQTVLKLMDDAITAMTTSSAASSGKGTSPMWMLLRGSFSLLGTPSHMVWSSFCTYAARYVAGRGRAAISSPVAPLRIA